MKDCSKKYEDGESCENYRNSVFMPYSHNIWSLLVLRWEPSFGELPIISDGHSTIEIQVSYAIMMADSSKSCCACETCGWDGGESFNAKGP